MCNLLSLSFDLKKNFLASHVGRRPCLIRYCCCVLSLNSWGQHIVWLQAQSVLIIKMICSASCDFFAVSGGKMQMLFNYSKGILINPLGRVLCTTCHGEASFIEQKV